MSVREDAAFGKWVDELAQKVQPEEAEAFKVWAKTDAAREVFRGTIGQAELYRRMNDIDREKRELASAREELEAWFATEAPKNDALLAERDALKAQLVELGGGGPPPAIDTKSSLSSEELADLKARAERAELKAESLDRLIPAVMGDLLKVVQDSAKEGFEVDPRDVIKYSLQNGKEPYQAYLDMTFTERQKREEKRVEEDRKKWFEEGRRAAMTSNSPDHLQPSGPSVVDYLQELNKATTQPSHSEASRSRVSAAMKEFAEGKFD